MKKESVKSLVLALLVISGGILTINNWFSEKLWPDGYNFFSNLIGYFSDGDEVKSYYLSKENVSNPAKIIVNNTDKRGVYTHTSDDFNDMVGTVKELLKDGLSQKKNVSQSSIEAWKDALKYKSIYISYPVTYGVKTFSAILDTPINALSGGNVQEFVLVSPDNITGKPHLIVKNASDNTYTDIVLSLDGKNISELTEKYAVSSSGEYPYSFELNFDSAKNIKEQKLTIDSEVTLPINPISVPTVTETNCFEDIGENPELYKELLRPFGFNTSNVRKNVNLDNSIVFAENYGTIKMYPDGLLEFKALNDSLGISIGNSTEFYDTFIDCIEFVNNTWDVAFTDENMNINLSSAKVGETDNSFVLTIDYYAEGMEVVSSIDATDSHLKLSHAIEIEVKNSKIISYRQSVKSYRSTGGWVSSAGVIDALNLLMATESIESDNILDLYTAYYPSEGSICTPHWVARTDKNEMRIIKPPR